MARSIKINDPFARSVEVALEHFADPGWLGMHSPLAAPYFLGDLLRARADAESPVGRGRVLQTVLVSASQALSPDQRHLLEVAFFKRDPALNNTGVALRLTLSETTYYRHRASAIEALAGEVNRVVLSPWRMDMPRAKPLVGRAAALKAAADVLYRRGTVALVGPCGIGKTALGAALVHEWGECNAFWYTIRPGLNDQFGALVFALACCLRSHGAAGAWRQLIADRGATDAARALALLGHDLSQLEVRPLICVDEVDALHDARQSHAQLIHLLESLRGLAPMVWIGQQVLLEADRYLTLMGLDDEGVAELLAEHGLVNASAADVAAVRAHTRGNPALVVRVADLWRQGDSFPDVLRLIASAPSVEALLARAWKRLGETERGALMALAVFDGAIPCDAWPDHRETLDVLVARALALNSGNGTLQLPSYVREFVRRRTPLELAARLHLWAAEVFESRGEYTAAARHYIQAGQPGLAIWTWFNHRELEVDRGRAAVARALFADIRADQLADEEDRRALAILRAELAMKAGLAEEAEAELASVSWPPMLPATPLACQLQGDALEAQGRIAQALEAYREAWRKLDASIESRAVALHIRSGYIHVNREPNLQHAYNDALLALWQAHHFVGHVQRQMGNYADAQASLNTALRIAHDLPNNRVQLARTHQSLSALFVHIADADRAVQHAQMALQLDRVIGDSVSILFDELNLSSALIIARRHDEALAVALAAASCAEEINHTFLAVGCYACAAEACFHLDRFDEAMHFAQRVLLGEEQVFRACALMVMGWVKARLGALGEAEQLFVQAIQEARESEDHYVEAQVMRSLNGLRLTS